MCQRIARHHARHPLKLDHKIGHLILNIFQRNFILFDQRTVQVNLPGIVILNPIPLPVYQIQVRFQQGHRFKNAEIAGTDIHFIQFLRQNLPCFRKSKEYRIIFTSHLAVEHRQQPLYIPVQTDHHILKFRSVYRKITIHIIQA